MRQHTSHGYENRLIYTTFLASLYGIPTDDEREEIAHATKHKWRLIGLQLGVNAEYLDTIDSDDPAQCCLNDELAMSYKAVIFSHSCGLVLSRFWTDLLFERLI